jgi:hypothetical protein
MVGTPGSGARRSKPSYAARRPMLLQEQPPDPARYRIALEAGSTGLGRVRKVWGAGSTRLGRVRTVWLTMPGPMEGPARTRLVALVVLLAVAVPLGVVAAAGSGGEDEAEDVSLRVERSTEAPEMLIYVTDDKANTPGRAGGRSSVTVECLDAGGRVLASQEDPWPMTQTDGNTLSPHAHVPVNPARIGDVASCRLRGTDPLLEADVS